MAFTSSTAYLDPDSYITEVVNPTGLNISTLPFAPCIIGTGSRSKTAYDEQVIRGLVEDEAISWTAGPPGDYNVTLANRALRKREVFDLKRTLNGVEASVPDDYWTFEPATVTGSGFAAASISGVGKAITVEADGLGKVTVILVHDSAAADVTVYGRQVTVSGDDTYWGAGATSPTVANVVAGINDGLNAMAALGFSATHAYATVSGGQIVMTSALTEADENFADSDMKVTAGFANSGLVSWFGGALEADTMVTMDTAYYNASATYAADYVALDTTTDGLENTSVDRVRLVGVAKGDSFYRDVRDWQLVSDEIDWDQGVAAEITGVDQGGASATLSGGTNIQMRVDGLVAAETGGQTITVDVSAATAWANAGPYDQPYNTVTDASPTTLANIVQNINAYLAAEFGPGYASVASVSGNTVVLTSPTESNVSSLNVLKSGTSTAATVLFGRTSFAGINGTVGTGQKPADGTTYFVTYDYERPSTDYDVPQQYFSNDDARIQLGDPSASVDGYNPLAIAVQLAFKNGAPIVYSVQIDDSTAGDPTPSEVASALDGAGTISGATEIIVVGDVGTRLETVNECISHLEVQNGPVEKHPRRYFHGMAANTIIGSRDVVNSLVGRSTRTMQVAANSVARGRMFHVVGPQLAGISLTVSLDDGSEVTIPVDSNFLAVAVAALRCGLDAPWQTLVNRTIAGAWDISSITAPWKPSQRRFMAGQGCLVVSFEGGALRILDPLSTEGGGGNLDKFKVDSTSYQKDVITTKVNQALKTNIVGLVPLDIASFLLDIKLVIESVLVREIGPTIGPYRDDTGNVRPLNIRTDIRVVQSSTSNTTYLFNYWYNLRYPALYLFGSYSVDAPAFSVAA